MCISVSENIFLIKKTHTHTHTQKKRQKAKEAKEEKIISVENQTRYNGIVCEFALCTFNHSHKKQIVWKNRPS